jgi:hypothetical protein
MGGHLLRRRGDDVPARMVDAAAILFTVLLGFLELRHLMNDGDVYRPRSGLAELALQVAVGLAMAIGFERIRARTGSVVYNLGALLIAALAALGIVCGLWTAENPRLKAQAEADDIVLLFADESEALTHPYLARAWAKRGADLRVPAPGQAKKVAKHRPPPAKSSTPSSTTTPPISIRRCANGSLAIAANPRRLFPASTRRAPPRSPATAVPVPHSSPAAPAAEPRRSNNPSAPKWLAP